MSIVDIVQWFAVNGVEILKVVAYIVAIASVVVKLTPTPKDDEVFAKVYAFLSKYIALNK